MKKTLSWLIVLAMVFAMIPAVFAAEETEVTYTKISTMEELTDGNYVIVCSNDVGLGYLDGKWVLTSAPVIDGDTVTDTAGAIWTLTVDGSNVKLADKNGKYIAPGSGNTNAIQEGEYNWAVSVEDGMFVFAGQGSDTTKLASNASSQNKFRAYKNTTISGNASGYPCTFALYKEVEVANEEPAPEVPANVLALGENVMNLEGNTPSVEYTYIAESAGTLNVQFTEVGYEGSAGYSTWDVGERFAGENDMGILFAGYLNGEPLSDLYKGSIAVEEGDAVVLTLEFTTPSNFFYKYAKSAKVNLSMAEGGGEVVAPEGEKWTVETTDTYGFFDTHIFTAPVYGEYTFNFPAGLGVTTPDLEASWSAPIVDFYDNETGYTYTIELQEGEQWTIIVGALERGSWDITYTVVEKELPPVEESTPVELGSTVINADTLYSFTAQSAGTLKIDASTGTMAYGSFAGSVYTYGNLILAVNGTDVDSLAQGIYELEVAEGDVVTIKVTVASSMYQGSTINLELTLTEPSTPVNDVVLGDQVIDGDVLYTFNATEAGTLVIDASSGTMAYGSFAGSVYNYGNLVLSVNGVDVAGTALGVCEIEIAAGDIVTIQVRIASSMYAGSKINLNLSMAAAGEDPVVITGSNLNIGNNSISPQNINFVYTAAEDGTLKLNMGNAIMGAVETTVYVNGLNPQALASGSSLELNLVAGDKVGIVITSAGYATLSAEWTAAGGGEIVECDHNYVDGVCEKCGESDPNYVPEQEPGDGSAGNPFIIDQLPYEATQESSDDLYYEYVATQDGKIELLYSNGMGVLSGSSVGSWESMTGGKYIEVAAGDVITINYWSGTGFSLAYAEESNEFTGTILESIKDVYVEVAETDVDYEYKWIATQSGKLTISLVNHNWNATYLFTATVNGQAFNYGDVELEVQEGDELLFVFSAASWASTGSLTFTGIYEGEVIEPAGPDGTQANPFIIESIPSDISITGVNFDYYYVWNADADATLVISIHKNAYLSIISNHQFDKVVDGNIATYTIEVKAGDELMLNPWSMSISECTMSLSYYVEGACQHTNTKVEGAQNATCGEPGHTGKTVCVDCGEELSAGTEIPATGEHSYVEGTCSGCGAADPNYQPENPNPGTGSMNILAIALIAVMSATAVVVTATKKSDEE